jgi:carbonic anhydrase/acetyltransferase-like protein (isoleucine patch superfamily)
MLLEHREKRPRVDPTAYVAPTAVVCGDVTIGEHSRILFGAIITAEGGPVTIGSYCIVMENAVIRGTPRHPARLGNHILVGPHAHLTGCTVEDNVFLATGTTVFNGARIGGRAEVRINGVVHVQANLLPGAIVPIGWIAVGDPAQIVPPQEHDRIWSAEGPATFPLTVFGLERAPARESIMPELTRRYARALGEHRQDRLVEAAQREE